MNPGWNQYEEIFPLFVLRGVVLKNDVNNVPFSCLLDSFLWRDHDNSNFNRNKKSVVGNSVSPLGGVPNKNSVKLLRAEAPISPLTKNSPVLHSFS